MREAPAGNSSDREREQIEDEAHLSEVTMANAKEEYISLRGRSACQSTRNALMATACRKKGTTTSQSPQSPQQT